MSSPWLSTSSSAERSLLEDRSYYRQLPDRALVECAKYNPNAELAIVLAERLKERRAY